VGGGRRSSRRSYVEPLWISLAGSLIAAVIIPVGSMEISKAYLWRWSHTLARGGGIEGVGLPPTPSELLPHPVGRTFLTSKRRIRCCSLAVS
jgi:hypothetical protein